MDDFKNKFYERTYRYALDILKFTRVLPRDSASSVLSRQLIRSATSVAANIIEAKAASSKADYINFYTYALKSANESDFWLRLIKDYLNLENKECDRLAQETKEISKILGASILTMKGKRSIHS